MFAFRVRRLGEVDHDDAVGVAGEHPRRGLVVGVSTELECQAVLWVLGFCRKTAGEQSQPDLDTPGYVYHIILRHPAAVPAANKSTGHSHPGEFGQLDVCDSS